MRKRKKNLEACVKKANILPWITRLYLAAHYLIFFSFIKSILVCFVSLCMLVSLQVEESGLMNKRDSETLVNTCVWASVCVFVWACVCMSVCVFVCVFEHVCVCVCVKDRETSESNLQSSECTKPLKWAKRRKLGLKQQIKKLCRCLKKGRRSSGTITIILNTRPVVSFILSSVKTW